mgnify:FL=1
MSAHEWEDKFILARELHEALIDAKYLCALLGESSAKCIEMKEDGLIIVIDINNKRLKMYINDDYGDILITIICNESYEPEETNMVCKLFEYYKEAPEFVMFDVGANVGWYSLNALKRIPNISLYAFEPSPVTYARLINNLEFNGFSRKVAHNIGFYHENGKLDFYYDKVRGGASSLLNIQDKDDIDKIEVDMMTMDDWAKKNQISRVDFIKCDVEGAELFVYKGGMEIIENSKPLIFSEMLRKWSAKFGYHPNDIIDLLASVGYECFVIKGDNLKKFDRVNEETIETNYFFLHPQKHAGIMSELCR